ncbi:disease resistance protein RGA2-like [Coffea arabica]|uniref:Disease resistance protein RGA2-like n=1 Tax=Coffea arabica TaxID=13443 RepID=A0ABM4VYN7_COFAR
MADAIVGATVQVLLEKALFLATDGTVLAFGFKDELENLRGSVAMIQATLADAEEDKLCQNKVVQLWLKRLKEVAFDADHVLDELHHESLRRGVESRNKQLKGKVCFFFFSCYSFITFRRRMAPKIRGINIKLKKINQGAHDFGLIGIQMAASLPASNELTISRQTDSIVGQNVVGRANDESNIVELLLTSAEKVVSVIPIVGMGGIGKTTLAKLVYNNPQIDAHFGKKIWICVSENFQEVELFKLILESLTGRKVDLSSKDAIVKEIKKEMKDNRYLLVLDDVWNEKPKLWDDFFESLAGIVTTNGSRCLVTTRLGQVATIVSRHSPYLLGKLSDDDCWSILKEKAISGGEVPEEFNLIRQQILKWCNGLPLAASVLGGLLRIKRKEEWLSIVENRLLNLKEGDNSVEQILKLSFDNLPSALIRKCFGYCSIFAKDSEIERDLLIELWMAEGFLEPVLCNQSLMEDVGDQYIRVLLHSSLLEEVKYNWKTCYKMHDLVHDLAESISKPECVKSENGGIDNYNQVRYLAINSSDGITRKILNDTSASVRTLFVTRSISGDMLPKFKNLHVLNLHGAGLKELPPSIGKLKHLRFLDLSNSGIKTLPESLCKLYTLQTLRIDCLRYQDGFPVQVGLPKQMSNLINLRHLHYFNRDVEFQMPMNIGLLTCLQTLELFNVGKKKGRQIEELRCLKNLKGKLVIRNLQLVNSKEGAERANLCGKPNLLNLEFLWSHKNAESDNVEGDVLEGLRPHPNLQELYICGFMGDRFPYWFMSLTKLVDLSLIDCSTSKELPAGLGQLPFLQKLEFSGLENVRYIGPSFYGIDDDFGKVGGQLEVLSRTFFRALNVLTLKNMGNLVEWMEPDINVFPMLEILTIEDCSKLTTAPSHFPSLKILEITKNDHVSVVKKILSKVSTTLSSLTIIGNTGMTGLTCLSDVAPGLIGKNLHNLKSLTLRKCPDLTRLEVCSTSLQNLELIHCENLRELPEDLCRFQALRNLEMIGCPRIHSIPNSNLGQQSLLKSLEHLKITDCNALASVDTEMLESCVALKWLCLYDCPNLVSFPILESLQQMPSLVGASFHNCPKLMTLPKGFGFLPSLRQVRIGPFSTDDDHPSMTKDNGFDWFGLISSSTLRSLEVYGLSSHKESLPHQLQYMTTLTHLYLHHFGMEALPDWLGNLVSLQSLHLLGCKKLRYLPSMAAMRCLTKLNYLHVDGCPLLKERCSPQSGPNSEWFKISQIPLLNIC